MTRGFLVGLVLFAAGCRQQYYEVTDLATGAVYHTRSRTGLPHAHYTGNAHFRELSTGDDIAIQNSRIRKITEAEAARALSAERRRPGAPGHATRPSP